MSAKTNSDIAVAIAVIGMAVIMAIALIYTQW